MATVFERILIGYGSESGNARALAQRLGEQDFLRPYAPAVAALNDIQPSTLDERDLLLIVSSSFGDGEAPANAQRFLDELRQSPTLAGRRYAVFGLGDTAYPRFCGFTQSLDALLAEKGGRAVINRVDADANFESFFTRWQPVLERVLNGDTQAGLDLHLRVVAYGEDHAFAAPVIERSWLSAGAPAAWRVRLNIAGSGIVYRAGDNLFVLPENDPALLERLAGWYGRPDAAAALRRRELRQIGKGVLRQLARLAGSEDLNAMLKASRRKALEAYLYGADLLDVLEDFCTPQAVPLESLVEMLSPCLPRAYSIASHTDGASVELCVRDVCYERRGRSRRGTATGWLLEQSDSVRIFSRANPGFYLPRAGDCPVLLIGTGTGIAPLLGLLREMAADGGGRESCLIFGEKRREKDFLYRAELEALCADRTLGRLITAFSRDGAAKYYVQHAIAEHADYVCDLLRRGAHVYVCGGKQHLESAVAEALAAVCPTSDADGIWQTLARQERLHLELY